MSESDMHLCFWHRKSSLVQFIVAKVCAAVSDIIMIL